MADQSSNRSKIERVIERYDLYGIGDELERRWTGGDGDSESLSEASGSDRRERHVRSESTRDLAAYFNRRVLETAIERSDVTTMKQDLTDLYEALTDESVGGTNTLVRSRLAREGLAIERVEDAFVSHQTIYRYLTKQRGATQPRPSDEERIENSTKRVQRLQGRTTAVTTETIESLERHDLLTVGQFDVLTDVQVLCRDCGRSYDATTLLESGHCECSS